ncbi:unnamed protein product [Closterium sp. NIES-53]
MAFHLTARRVTYQCRGRLSLSTASHVSRSSAASHRCNASLQACNASLEACTATLQACNAIIACLPPPPSSLTIKPRPSSLPSDLSIPAPTAP